MGNVASLSSAMFWGLGRNLPSLTAAGRPHLTWGGFLHWKTSRPRAHFQTHLWGARTGYFLGFLPKKAWLLGVDLVHVCYIMQEGCRQVALWLSRSSYDDFTQGVRW